MIGSDLFISVFGGAPSHTETHYVEHLRAVIRAGFSPVLCKPGTKEPACVLSAAGAKRADREAQQRALAANPKARVDRIRHACGMKHVLDDPAKIGPIVRRFLEIHGGVNVALHLGRSRMLVVDVDTPSERQAFEHTMGIEVGGITVESPGSFDITTHQWVHWGGGHWWFTLPEGFIIPPGKVLKGPGGWAAMYGESYALVPPASRPEGAYRLVGGTTLAPSWLLEQLTDAGDARQVSARDFVLNHDDPIEQWSAWFPWASFLEPDGWTESGSRSECGCPEWTAPGDHASPKSATAHEPGCTFLDTSTGWGPLHIWTDHPPEQLVSSGGTVTKLDYMSRMRFNGDVKAAMGAAQLLAVQQVVPSAIGFDPDGADADPFGTPGGVSPGVTPPAGPVVLPWSTPTRSLVVQRASQMTPRATRWLWAEDDARWLALGGLSLLGGREGIGKSTWAYRIAAQVTRGTLPGTFWGHQRSVVIAATEDAWEQTVVPRLMAADADLARVFRVDVQTPLGIEGLSLPQDNAQLRAFCQYEQVALILLDPLMGTVSAGLDTHKDAEVRRALEPLSRMAHELGLSILGLIHQNKSTSGDLLTKLMGSRAFSAVARGVLVASEDKSEVPEDVDPSRCFVFGQAKNNLGPLVGYSYRYAIEGARVGFDQDLNEPIFSSRIQLTGTTEERIGDLVHRQEKPDRAAPARDKAGDWLIEYLEACGVPVPSSEVRDKAETCGIPQATLYRAAARKKVTKGANGLWSLPPTTT